MTETEKETQDIRENLRVVKARVSEAALSANRDPSHVEVVAVSKTRTESHISGAIAAGHRLFGENRIQESEEKWPAILEEIDDIRLHLVGPLQSNKVKRAVQLFHAIQTLDRLKLAHMLAREFDSQGLQLNCFIQINTGEERQKAGILPADADKFIKACREDLNIPIAGLMCIPPVSEEPGFHFALLSSMAEHNGLKQISMGMSGDFETAVKFGATFVRVGTAIFGQRS